MSNPDRLEQVKRRRAIYAMRTEGATLRAIGKQFEISVERVRQLIVYVELERKKYGDIIPEALIERKSAEHIERKKLWRDHRGIKFLAHKSRS